MVVLEAMALRWLFGKAVTYLVAHGSTTALTSAGMHVAASILASVEGAGTLAGAAAVLHAQEPLVKAVWKGLKQRDGMYIMLPLETPRNQLNPERIACNR
ncbi:hypothetical protein FRB95_010545 [Tulasnella sp. JGI-2019a]|nr:hypothetical protein FRB95_010545 [Tulasnella sp. JGI-2019a]